MQDSLSQIIFIIDKSKSLVKQQIVHLAGAVGLKMQEYFAKAQQNLASTTACDEYFG